MDFQNKSIQDSGFKNFQNPLFFYFNPQGSVEL